MFLIRYSLALLVLFVFAAANVGAETIKIGVVQSLTGIAAEYGKNEVDALQMARDQINAHSTDSIELIVEDDQTDPKRTVAAYQKLKAQGVQAIIGSTWDFTTNAIIPLAARDKLVLFNMVIPEVINLSQGGGYVFTNVLSLGTEAQALQRYLQKTPVKSVTVMYANNSWGEGQLASYTKVLKANNVAVLDSIRTASFDQNDWAPILPKVKAHAPELILMLVNQTDIDLIVRKMKELGMDAKRYTSLNCYDAFRNSASPQLYEGLCCPYPLEQLQKNAKFLKTFEDRFHYKARLYTDASYDALFILVEAIKAAKQNKSTLTEELRNTKYMGLQGQYKFDPELTLSNGSTSLVCYKNGKLELVN